MLKLHNQTSRISFRRLATLSVTKLQRRNMSANERKESGRLLGLSTRAAQLLQRLKTFMDEKVYPAEKVFVSQLESAPSRWTVLPIIEQLKSEAKRQGLWNLFLPDISGLSQLEYAHLAEVMGRSPGIAPEAFNCSAPDTGNMEVLHMYGSNEQKRQWLEPLLDGRIRSVFCMTEPAVASSDATNMECTIEKNGDHYVINGRKWWSSGAGDPRCKIAVLMGRTGSDDMPKHKQHSMILVPMDSPGVQKIRPLHVFGYDEAPHGHFEIKFENVRVPVSNMILGEGRGFEIAQGRLGPGRIHHCMRLIGMSERAVDMMCKRAISRTAFGKPIARQGVVQHQIAQSRIEIEQARLLTLNAADTIDTYGTKVARAEIAMIKVVAPQIAQAIVDRAIQIHGGAGVCQDTPLPMFFSYARSIRIADGPDEVHFASVAKHELKKHLGARL